ncbi:GCN5-related N-acetyltransferase 4 [Cardamine amara subsp. amara]|uniref:GCN5-related N-acetyltransferase 4 n=1 Tax=Cardamine amara subsp. amara TaxID=228776 RepID=A0ABD0Z2S4_CARAN
MQSTPLGTTTAVSAACINHNSYGRFVSSLGVSNFSFHRRRRHSSSLFLLSPMLSTSFRSGACNASQIVDLFPAVSPEIVVREARLEDCWEVAETHCSSFFPGYSFPLDVVLRVDRLMAMIMGFSIPPGCRRTCLVAVIGSSVDETISFGSDDFKIGAFDAKISLNKGYVTGILTVDTVADFLPRKGPLRQRRTGIAYISNVAVRENFRRKGIAKRLIWKAEALAKNWGCRAIGLHCDLNNLGATKLYKDQGFRCIKIPEGATWPKPKTSPDTRFNFMMKLLNNNNTQALEQFR